MAKSLSYQTYLINLDRSEERLSRMIKLFKEHDIDNYERVSAVDARNIKEGDYILNNRYDRDLVPGEIGCFMSHIKVMKTFLESDYEFALIIEDDAKLEDNFKYAIEKAMGVYSDLPFKHQWDVLKLVNGKRRSIHIQQLDDTYFIGACGTSIPITTIAAIWTRKGAEKLLKKVVKNGIPVVKRPIDCELQHAWEYNLRIYNLLPTIANGSNAASEIQYDASLRKSKFLRQIRYELNRLIPKYNYYISHHGLKKFADTFIFKKTMRVK